MDGPNERYNSEVYKKLEAFKAAIEWTDFISMLNALQETLVRYKADYIPHFPLLIKRLNQCLSPVLPAGVHLKTIETYATVFDKLPKTKVISDFPILSLGILQFGLYCRILVLSDYMRFLENYIFPLAPYVPGSTKDILVGVLPALESESSEFFNSSFELIYRLYQSTDPSVFFDAIWHCFIEVPFLQIPIINFIFKTREMSIPDYRLATKAYSVGFLSPSHFVVRSMLDMVDCRFPVSLCAEEVDANATEKLVDNLQKEVLKEVKADGDVYVAPVSKDDKSDTISSMSYNPTPVPGIKQAFKIAKPEDSKVPEEPDLLESYNTQIIRNFLLIFLGKEAGLNRRAFKWLTSLEEGSKEFLCLERALRTYISPVKNYIQLFFKIFQALSDKENLAVILMDRLIFDLLDVLYKKCPEPQKYSLSFGSLSLDDLWLIFHVKLSDAYSTDPGRQASKYSATHLLTLIIFAMENFPIFDDHVRSIHLPLVAILLYKHKEQTQTLLFYRFLELFMQHSIYEPGDEPAGDATRLVEEAYAKQSFDTLTHRDLIKALGDVVGDINKYKGDDVLMEYKCAILTEENGVLSYPATDSKMNQRINDLMKETAAGYVPGSPIPKVEVTNQVFSHNDILFLQSFIKKFTKEQFSAAFLTELTEFLKRNYKYKGLIDLLEINNKDLYRVIWNDYLRTGVASYIFHYNISSLILTEYIKTKENHKPILRMLREIAGSYAGSKVMWVTDCSVDANEAGTTYFDVLFEISRVARHNTAEYLQMIFHLKDITQLLEYLLDKLSGSGVSSSNFIYNDKPEYETWKIILYVIRDLMKKREFRMLLTDDPREKKEGGENSLMVKFAREPRLVKSKMFGEVGARQAVVSMLMHLALNEENGDEENAVENASVWSNETGLREREHEKEITSLCIQRNALRVLYKLFSLGIPIHIEEVLISTGTRIENQGPERNKKVLERLRTIISKNRDDFIILASSLFLLIDDHDFILNHCMVYYDEVFAAIQSANQSTRFFSQLPNYRNCLSSIVLLESIPYILKLEEYKWDEFYNAAMTVAVEEMNELEVVDGVELGDRISVVPELVERFVSSNQCVTNEVVGYKLANTIRLCSKLWEMNQKLFATVFSSLEPSSELFCLFSQLDFKSDLISVCMGQNPAKKRVEGAATGGRFPVVLKIGEKKARVLRSYLPFLSEDEKSKLVVVQEEVIWGIFGTPAEQPQAVLLSVELIIENSDARYRGLLIRLLEVIERRVVSAGRNCQTDVLVLSKMQSAVEGDPTLLPIYKNCLFGLLRQKQWREDVLDIIKRLVTRTPENDVVSEAFLNYFRGDFFSFGIKKKRDIMASLCSAPGLEQSDLLESLFSGLDTSYFMSSQNNSQNKVATLKRISFLILSNKNDMFAPYADRLIGRINMLLGECLAIRKGAFLLCTVMLLKISHSYLQHLYPILLESVLQVLLNDNIDIGLLDEIIRIIDLCVWMDSNIFLFESFCLKDCSFYTKLLKKFECEEKVSWGSAITDVSSGAVLGEDSKFGGDLEFNAEFIEDSHMFVYRNLFKPGGGCKGIGCYLRVAPGFYDWVKRTFMDKDYFSVEESLLEEFLQ